MNKGTDGTTGILVLLCFADTVFFIHFFVGGNSASRKSISAIFQAAFARFVSLCHILVILTIFQTFSLLLHLLQWFVISNL